MKIFVGNSLKWQHQPTHRSSSWLGSILEQRLRVRDFVSNASSLKQFFAEAVDLAYGDGAKLASREAGLPIEQFPATVPYPLERLLDDDWLPEQR